MPKTSGAGDAPRADVAEKVKALRESAAKDRKRAASLLERARIFLAAAETIEAAARKEGGEAEPDQGH